MTPHDDARFRFEIVKEVDRNGTALIAVRGELDAVTAGTLAGFLANTLSCRRPDHLVVDLAGVPFLDAVGVRALIAGYLRAAAGRTTFRVVGAEGLVRYVLEVTGTLEMLTGGRDNPGPARRARVIGSRVTRAQRPPRTLGRTVHG